jgi:hypothetical protein
MAIDLKRMHWLEWAVWLIPFIVIGAALGGLFRKRGSFTSSLFWRLTCFVLPILPMCLALVVYGICKLVGYDNGRLEAFHPDNFACGCFFIATPVYILVALVFSVFAEGVRLFASALNLCLGVVWFVAITHLRM